MSQNYVAINEEIPMVQKLHKNLGEMWEYLELLDLNIKEFVRIMRNT